MKLQKRSLSTFSKVMMIVLGVTALVLVVTTLLEQCGYHLLRLPEFNLLGCVAMIVEALIWGAGSIRSRLRGKNSTLIFTMVAVLVIMLVGMFLSTYIMQFGQLTLPHAYGSIKSPTGRTIEIVSAVDTGLASEEDFLEMLARMDERRAYIEASATPAPEGSDGTAAQPTTAPEESAAPVSAADVSLDDYPYGAYGYMFCAYPRKLGLFYDSNVSVEGLIYRGAESQSRLCYEWIDDTTVRFYLEDPEPGDSGEVLLSF